tara:strand:+ start:6238 stop:6420 length:183 start_codon:yes stop_codon:yes gene_type:complete
MLYHSSVDSFYEINFALMHYHKWSLSEIENMIPFERDIYMKYLMNALEKEKLEAQQAANA